MQLYYRYKTINLINDRFYYGVRKSNNIFDDTYLGSGKILHRAIDKYGRSIESFKKEIVYVFCDRKEAYDWERSLVTQDFIDANPLCYNIKPGGSGGGISGKGTHKRHSAETKRKIGLSHKGKKRKPFTEETRLKMRSRHVGYMGRRHSEETKTRMSLSHNGHEVTEETKKKIGAACKDKTWVLENNKRMWKQKEMR